MPAKAIHPSFNGGSGAWRQAKQECDVTKLPLMRLTEQWAVALEHSPRFTRTGHISRVVETRQRLFFCYYGGERPGEVMLECVKLLITHKWKYAQILRDSFYGSDHYEGLPAVA